MEPPADESRVTIPSKTPEQVTSTFIYLVGGFLYAVLCGPAIGQRGFPPIDPGWTAATFLWVPPIVLSGILDDRPFRRRLNAFFFYAMATAFVDAASVVTVVPKHVDFLETVMATIFLFGPLHLVIGLLLAAVTQGA